MSKSIFNGIGSYLPEKILTNDDIAKIVDTNDEWIIARTGIKQRHIAAENESTADMAYKAAFAAIESSAIDVDDIDLIILATTTPDNTFPSTACKVQAMLGIKHGAAFDIQAVCSGFIYAISVADNFIKTGQHKNILVIGADKLTNIIDWNDRGTCILFGDGAGAAILSAADDKSDRGIFSTHLHSDGSMRDLLYVDGGVSTTKTTGVMHMAGSEVFKHAVQKMADCTIESLKKNNISASEVDWVVPHQANLRIMDAVMRRLKLPKDKLIVTVDKHANTSAATIPLALDVAVKDGRIKQGDIVAMQALGGGLSWGSCLVRW